jgi:hypothetical protein
MGDRKNRTIAGVTIGWIQGKRLRIRGRIGLAVDEVPIAALRTARIDVLVGSSSFNRIAGGGRSPSMKLALVALAVTFAVAVTGETILVVVEPIEPAWVVALFPLLGFEYAITGIVAWWR